jgi:hypothetical protein
MDDTLHRSGLVRFRWLLLGAVAVGCSLNPQPDLPAPRGGGDVSSPDAGETGGTAGSSSGEGAASSGGSINIGDDLCEGGVGGQCPDQAEQGGVPGEAGAGTVTAKEAGAGGIAGAGGAD